MRYPRLIGTMLLATMVITPIAQGQRGPTNGMRETEVRAHAIVNATIIVRPVQRLEGANLVIRDGIIESVGVDVNIPTDAQIWDATGLTVYPGFIDAALLIDPGERESSPGAHWNDLVHPEINMIDQPLPDAQAPKEELQMMSTSVIGMTLCGTFWLSHRLLTLVTRLDRELTRVVGALKTALTDEQRRELFRDR